jgi:hypothetical protein
LEAPARQNFEGDVARLETAHRERSPSQFTKQLNQNRYARRRGKGNKEVVHAMNIDKECNRIATRTTKTPAQ